VTAAMGSLGVVVGAREVSIGRVTPRRLRAPLARCLRAAPQQNREVGRAEDS
jgi:hypothetical protein